MMYTCFSGCEKQSLATDRLFRRGNYFLNVVFPQFLILMLLHHEDLIGMWGGGEWGELDGGGGVGMWGGGWGARAGLRGWVGGWLAGWLVS